MLDTNICIYIIKKKQQSVLEKFESLPICSVAMSLVTYGELEFGALRSNNPKKALDIFDEIAAYIPLLSIPAEAANEYADIRADMTAKGLPIGNNDLWIASHARAHGHILVSNNVKEFERVANLRLENWVRD